MPRIPTDAAGILRVFASVPRRQFEREWAAANPTIKKASVQRTLQRWGLAGKKDVKQRRNPDKVAQAKLRGIIIARSFPAKINVSGTIGYNEADDRPRVFHVAPVSYEMLGDLIAVAAAVDESGAQEVNGEEVGDGEQAATFIFTGWYFGDSAIDIVVNGAVVAHQAFVAKLKYADDCRFTIERLRESGRAEPRKKAG